MESELLVQESRSMLDRAHALRVNCDEDYSEAGEFILGCKALIKRITEAHQANIDRWHAGHKEAIRERDENLIPVKSALDLVSQLAISYKKEQDRLAEEERKQIERERVKREEEERLKEAERLAANGKESEAEALLEKPIETPRPFRAPSVLPSVAGLSTRKTWKVKILNAHYVSRPFCMPDQTLLNMHVKQFFAYNSNPTTEQLAELVEKMGGVKAVELYKEETFAGRVKA